MPPDHYRTLGAAPGATAADLRAAYLKLARANHPDMFDGPERREAELRMQAINEAWNVLGVAHKRHEYDARRPEAGGKAPGSSRSRGRAHFEPFDDVPTHPEDFDFDATPIAGSRAIPRWLSFAPVLLVAGGIPVLSFGAMVNGSGVVALGAIMIVLGFLAFLLLPLLVMSRAERDPNL